MRHLTMQPRLRLDLDCHWSGEVASIIVRGRQAGSLSEAGAGGRR